jgi:hypothetical protein
LDKEHPVDLDATEEAFAKVEASSTPRAARAWSFRLCRVSAADWAGAARAEPTKPRVVMNVRRMAAAGIVRGVGHALTD